MKKLTLPLLSVALGFSLMACDNPEKREAPARASAPKMSAALPAGQLTYAAPAEWVREKPLSRMRKDQFKLPGAAGEDDAELIVFYFQGMGGSVQQNLDRWYGQMVQPDGSDTKSKAAVAKSEVNGIPVTITYVEGTYQRPINRGMVTGPKENLPDYAMLAAIAETASGPWFFKMIGPKETVAQWRPEFDAFVKTFKLQ